MPSPHWAVGHETIWPVLRSLFHSSEKSASVLIRSSSTMSSQNWATSRVSGLSMSTVQVSPSMPNQLAPFCQASAVNHAELPGGKVQM